MADDEEMRVSEQLRHVLNSHGHGFHYALLRHAEELFKTEQSHWFLELTELPVSVGNHETHIDFILRRRELWQPAPPPKYLVGECKRVNPALNRWCFVRTPYTKRNPSHETTLIFDAVSDGQPGPYKGQAFRKTYNLGTEIKGRAAGDADGAARGAINNALTQALRGTSGLINHMYTDGTTYPKTSPPQVAIFIPAVFTTAELWVSEVNLGLADLQTGSLNELSAKRVDWIWFNYNRSSSMQHNVNKVHRGELSEAIEDEFTRSVAIIGSDGLTAFLCAEELMLD